MSPALQLIATLTRHELTVALRTRRALILGLIYLVAALFGGAAYITGVRLIEEKAMTLLIEQGLAAAEAASTLSLASEQAYQQIVAYLAGADVMQVAADIRESIILPAFLWASLAFLPFLIVLTSFDDVASELSSRSLCYTVLRAPRYTVILSKVLAQAVLFVVLTMLASLALVVLATVMLDSFSPADGLLGLGRVWLLLLPYGLAYLALSLWMSASFRQPALALFSALGVMLVLRVLGWLGSIPDDSAVAFLRFAKYLSPATYQSGLWQLNAQTLTSTLAYLGFAGVFIALAIRRLEARDL